MNDVKKKVVFGILITITILGVLVLGTYYYFYRQEVTVLLKEDLTVPFQTEVTNLSFIKKVKNGKVMTESQKIDTSKVGKAKIKLVLKNNLGRKEEYTFEVNVLDITPPEITYQETLSTIEKTEINLLEKVTAVDDSDGNVEVKVEGEYDFNQPNTYSLFYVAKDSSGNETRKEFKLIVEKKKETPSINSNRPDRTFTTSKGFSGYTKNGVTYIEGILIANKTYSLPSNYGNGLTGEMQNAFNTMQEAAKREGIDIYIISGFRSYSRQNSIYNNYVSSDGKENADRYSARPGHSEHQTGLAADINSLYTSFENTPEGKWLSNNAYKYGFILRYTKNGEHLTGYMFEPWHYRYVGVDLATKLYNNGNWITMEEYFGITSQY